jgi:hypothetical protein
MSYAQRLDEELLADLNYTVYSKGTILLRDLNSIASGNFLLTD